MAESWNEPFTKLAPAGVALVLIRWGPSMAMEAASPGERMMSVTSSSSRPNRRSLNLIRRPLSLLITTMSPLAATSRPRRSPAEPPLANSSNSFGRVKAFGNW